MPWNQPQAGGSRGLANGGIRALGEARKANFTLQRNLCKQVLLLGCVGLGSLGRSLGCCWPGESGPGLWKPRARQRGLRALDEARKANFTFQQNLSIYVVLGARSAGWAGLGILTGQERPVAGQGKPRARKRWTESPGRGQESQFYADPRVRCAWLAGQASGLQLARRGQSQARGSSELASVD